MSITEDARVALAWAEKPIPAYGSHVWQSLERDDPQRLAAVYLAAECWREHRSTERVAEELRGRLAAEDAAVVRRLSEAAVDVRANLPWVADWRTRVAETERLCAEMAREHSVDFERRRGAA